jgi:putative colanic acid biosynthesis acetyltransferase WcaF
MQHINRNQTWNLKYKFKRGLWGFTWLLLFRPTPKRIGKNWRVFLLKIFGCKFSGDALIAPSVKILEPWNLVIGKYVAIGSDVSIYNHAVVNLGDNVIISQGTELCTSSHDYSLNSMPLTFLPITIKEHCWITSHCFIHPGVTVGEGAVIGACSVVNKDVEEWTVNAGNPCRRIKKREFNFDK